MQGSFVTQSVLGRAILKLLSSLWEPTAMRSLRTKLRCHLLISNELNWLLLAEGEELSDVGRSKSLLRWPDCKAPSRKVYENLIPTKWNHINARFLADFLISVVTAIFEDQISMDSLIVQVIEMLQQPCLPGDASRTQAGRGGPRVPLPRRPEDDAVVRADLRGHRWDGRRGDPAGGRGRPGKTEVPPRQGACWSRGHPGETGHCARLQQGTYQLHGGLLDPVFHFLEITL